MVSECRSEMEAVWLQHDRAYRDPSEVIAFGWGGVKIDPRLYDYEVSGKWWETLNDLGVTLLVTREYEHLLLSLRMDKVLGPRISMLELPHPSGVAVDSSRGVVHVAATRNPNLIIDLMPARGLMRRSDIESQESIDANPLLPVRARFLPGCLYIHDLVMVDGRLHANAVGENTVVRISDSGMYDRVWWPQCIETAGEAAFEQNYLQLNSIAAGQTIEKSFFSASTDEITEIRPGNPAFPVDRRGVIFSGTSRKPIARGLTRPHSARLKHGRVWVDNSGYGEVGFIDRGGFFPVFRLPGWTRGLCFWDRIIFVGTSRVLPRFRGYAPGVNMETARCGIHALNYETGEEVGSIIWPFGSQVFAVECLPEKFSTGLPFGTAEDRCEQAIKNLFYSYDVKSGMEE